MTTVAQVKQVVQPLLRRNPDLALVGRLVIIKPVHHILRGISIGRSLNPDLFVPNGVANVLLDAAEGPTLNWSAPVYCSTGAWEINAFKNLPEMLCEAIETQALPLLHPLRTIDDFFQFASDEERFPLTHIDAYQRRMIFIEVARGKLDAAHLICQDMAAKRAKRRQYHPDIREECDPLTEELCPLIETSDHAGSAKILHRYEEHAARKLKIEKYWEPTPFPIELGSSAG